MEAKLDGHIGKSSHLGMNLYQKLDSQMFVYDWQKWLPILILRMQMLIEMRGNLMKEQVLPLKIYLPKVMMEHLTQQLGQEQEHLPMALLRLSWLSLELKL